MNTLENKEINIFIDKINNTELKSKEEFWSLIEEISINYQNKIRKNTRKDNGIYYTGLNLAENMINELFNKLLNHRIKEINKMTFFEPCVGIGIFVFKYLDKISSLNMNNNDIIKVIKNIYVNDVDSDALNIYIALMNKFLKVYFGITLEKSIITQNIRHGILFDLNLCKDNEYISLESIYPEVYENGGFDIIVTNPPYKNIKAERNMYVTDHEYEIAKSKYKKIGQIAKKNFQYTIKGTLNLYKLFVEDIVVKYSKDNAIINLLIPNTILTDKSCELIRTYILEECKLINVSVIPESSNQVDAKQALCTMLIDKGSKTDSFMFNEGDKVIEIIYEDIKLLDLNNSILSITDEEYKKLKILKKYKTIKELDFIVNMRGELDLTKGKWAICEEKTENILLRGKDVAFYNVKYNDIKYVKREFVNDCPKQEFIFKERLACQQIANLSKQKRLSFTYIPKDVVLGNSCNFITLKENEFGLSIYSLLGILNSEIMEWFFKIISSNNHINNYEIDMFPIPLDKELNLRIEKLVCNYIEKKDDTLLIEINKLVNEAFNIDSNINKKEKNKQFKVINKNIENMINDLNKIIGDNSISYEIGEDLINGKTKIEALTNLSSNPFFNDVLNGIITKYCKLNESKVLNHNTFKLSDLDMEMVVSIPQGGNWKNIPEEVVKKSKRLISISEKGGRTTLYGRIDYNKPSYTITTYFNRPGNGTYIHPIKDRVLSVREAARFQSFKDDYYFYGNQGAVLNQVGNAVPPILIYLIANKVKSKVNCSKSLDLFAGAGGITSGLKLAGIDTKVAIDFDKSACKTLKINNPDTNVICGDITLKEVKDQIVDLATKNEVDIICGGPPCQGFSYAGKRFVDDPRNKLFKEYVEIVSRIKPNVFIMENVEGILTAQGGKVYEQINMLFKELDYNVSGKLLMASQYCVPQRRKRLILIGVKNELGILAEEMFPYEIIINRADEVPSYDVLHDLEEVECGLNSKYTFNNEKSSYIKYLQGDISVKSFIESFLSKIKSDDFKEIAVGKCDEY